MIYKNILLVEDDPDDQMIFIDTLKEIQNEIECITADNGKEALTLLTTHRPPPSLIFLDLNMPLMNGFECLEYIKKEKQLKEIPVIIFTTSNSPIDKTRTLELGAKTFINKTPDTDALKEKLQKILTGVFE